MNKENVQILILLNKSYQEGVRKIPAACITMEDAQMLHRIHKRGVLF